MRVSDHISSQSIPSEHVSSPKQSIFTSPWFEQIFISRHELSKIHPILISCVWNVETVIFLHDSYDKQSISICCVCIAKIFKSSHEAYQL